MNNKPRILIVGANGQLGQELVQSFTGSTEIIAVGRDTVDLTRPDQVRDMIQKTAPDVILNAAAYTAVDRAESEREVAMAINAHAPGIMAEEAQRINALLVHYSTDYVFDGSKAGPWLETDKPDPLNAYGLSKLAGEQAIQQAGGKHLILRTSWVYGPYGNNFFLTMLHLGSERESLKIVDDQVGAPTSSIELAIATQKLVSGVLSHEFGDASRWAGLYHMTCAGAVTWRGFAEAIFTRTRSLRDGRAPVVHPIPTSEYPTPARRPHNSVLSNEKLQATFGVTLAPWETALDEVIHRLTLPE